MIDYAKAIKEYRERKFLTQVQLADVLGVKFVTISRLEGNRAFRVQHAHEEEDVQGSRHENRMSRRTAKCN
ncbi:MAG TPA: helix-turn-helix transcriptional regulator [Candidatus Enterosoma merdigallinarum]|nr:helix-turn-helix transcriptional regulator [Candidatus Enterosoma merdigallinarum]